MLLNRSYALNTLIDNSEISSEIDFLFVGNSAEVRSQKTVSLLDENYKGARFSINYDIESEKYSILPFQGQLMHRTEDLDKIGKDLVVDFIDDLRQIGIDNKSILIDITSIKHPLVFYLILILKKYFNPSNLFISYTEPQKYKKSKNDLINDKFDLTERFCEVKSLPGFLRVINHNKEKLLVAIMGFEGNRFNKAFNDINPAERKTTAIVGFPSFYPSWQYYVYSQNQNALEQSKSYAMIKRATANDPFGVYNALQKIKKNNSKYELFLAPIGTKPHSLGASMFAIDNLDVQLYYDFPSYGKKIRTIGVGQTLIYNLTDFINE